MRVALYVAAVLAAATATPSGYYHQEYNYKTSAASYRNNELQHKTDDQGYYSKDGDLEGRIKPKVKSNSEHSEYVNPKLREQGNVDYYGNGLDVMSHGNMLANTYGASAGGQLSSGYGAGSQYSEGLASSDYIGGAGYSSSYGSESSYASSSSLQSIASRLQNDLQREMQSALIGQAHQVDISQLEAELHRNLTARLNELLQERFGTQTIRSGQSYSLHEGRVQGRPNYEQREIEQLQHQIERGLLDKLRQEYNYRSSHSTHYNRQDTERYVSTTTYRPVTYRPIYPNLNVIDNQDKYATYGVHQSEYGTHGVSTNVDYHQRPNAVSVTTIASNVQRDLNNQLNRILEDVQRQYFSENARYTEFNGASLLDRLRQDLKHNLTYTLDEELRRNFGTQIQKNGYMFTVGSTGDITNQYNYNIADLENLRRQVEENLITKLNRDFESARQHWISRQQHVQSQQTYHGHGQVQSNDYVYSGSNNLRYEQSTPKYPDVDYYRPTAASIVPLISSGVKGNYQASSSGHMAQIERQLQSDLSNQLQAALSQNRAYLGRYSSSSSAARESFDDAYRRLYEELQRNLTQQLHSFEMGGGAYSSSYGGVNENQLAELRTQLQRSLASQLQQGLQQSYSASASYSASSSSSSSSAGAGAYSSGSSGGYYRPTRGSSDYIVGQYMGGASYSMPDCQGDDPLVHEFHRSKRSYGYRSRPLGLTTHGGAGFSARGTYGGYSGGYSSVGQEEDDSEIIPPVRSTSALSQNLGQEIDDTDETQQVEIDPGFNAGQVERGQEEDDSDITQQVDVDHQFGAIGLGSQSSQTGYGRRTTQNPIYYTRPATVADLRPSSQRGDMQQVPLGGNQIGQEEDNYDDVQRVEGNDFADIDAPSSRKPVMTQTTPRPYRPSGYGTNYQPKYNGNVYGGKPPGQGDDDIDDTQQIEIDHGFSSHVTDNFKPASKQTEFGSPQSTTPRYPVHGYHGYGTGYGGQTLSYNPSRPIPTKKPLIVNYGTQNVLPEPESVEPLPSSFQGSVPSSPRPQTNNIYIPVQSGPVTIGNTLVPKSQVTQPSASTPINIPFGLEGVSEQILLDLTLQVEDVVKTKLPTSSAPDQLYKETLYNLRASITRECQKILSDSKYFYLNIHQKDINILETYVETQMIQRTNQLFESSPYVTPGSINYEPVPQLNFNFVNTGGVNPPVFRPRPQVSSSNTFLENEINSHGGQHPLNPNPNQFRPEQFDEIVRGKPAEVQPIAPPTSENDRQNLANAENQADLLIQTLRTFLLEKKGQHSPKGIVQVKLENLTPEQLEIIDELVKDASKIIDHEVEKIEVPNVSAKEELYRVSYVNIYTLLQNYLRGCFEGNLNGYYPSSVVPNLDKYAAVLDEKFSPKELSTLQVYLQIKLEKKLKASLNKKLNVEAADYTDEVVKFHKPAPQENRVFHLEDASPTQRTIVTQIENDFSRLIDLEIQNIRIPVYLDDKNKLKHFENTLNILEQNLIKNISDSLKGSLNPSGQSADLSKYPKLVSQTFELQTVPLLQEYLEDKLIKTLKTKLRHFYNIEALENTQGPIPDETHGVKTKTLTQTQAQVLNAITNDFSHLIDIAIHNIQVPTNLDDESKLEDFQISVQKLEQELKRNLTDLLEDKINPYSGPVELSKYSNIIKSNFDLESLSILQEYLEISLTKKLRAKLSRVYHIEITEETYLKPPQKAVRVVKLENITPEQLTIINDIENDFSTLIDLAIEKIYIPQNIGEDSKFEDYKMFLNLLEQQLVRNLSDTIQGNVDPASYPVNLARYSILINRKFDHQKIPTLQEYLEIKLTKKLKSKLSTAYNIETAEDTREVRRIVKPNPREMRVVKLENVTPEQMTLINQIENDFSNLMELALENVYVPDDLDDISKFDQYMITINKLEQQVKRNLSDCIAGRGAPAELLKYSNLVHQKFESQKISVLEEYLEIKLIKKLRVQLKRIYNIQDDSEIAATSPYGHSVRVVRLENITPAQLKIIKQIEADLARKVDSGFSAFTSTLNLNADGDYDHQSTLHIENQLKNDITEVIEKISEPGFSEYSELVSQNFDPTKINKLKQYLQIKLTNKIREGISRLPGSQIHYQSSSSVHVSHHSYPIEQPVNQDIDTHLQFGAQGSVSGSGSVPQTFDEVSNNLELTEPTTEAESWWKRFGKKVKQGASSIKSKIIGSS